MSRKALRRRELLAGGAAAAIGAAVGPAASGKAVSARPRHRVPRPHLYDVAIVGAGLAGLSAARAIRAAGHSVIVLEARNRVGGRNLDHSLGRGKVAELGGQWAGPGQDRVLGLAKELGVSTFPTYADGESVYFRSGELRKYSGDVPPAAPATLGELGTVIVELNQMATSVSPGRPWSASRAEEWDQQTIASWMVEHVQSQEGRDLAMLAIRGVYGEEASQISLLDLVSSIAGVGGDFNTLIGSAQSIRFVGGPQQLSKKLARNLGSRVRTGVAVTGVEQASGVALHAGNDRFLARRAILTAPKPLLGRITYSPPLPPGHDQLLQRQPMGSVIKFNAIYATPFWRAGGLNGAATSDTGPVRITYDNSPPDAKPGILVGFMEGDDSREFYASSLAVRRQAVLRSLARYFGPRALHPVGYVDLVWAREPFTRGAYGSFNPPGVLTSLHDAAAQPTGALHFAGADSSPQWPGYMDGAIRSGERAAREVLARL